MPKTILDNIVADKKKELAAQKRLAPMSALKERIAQRTPRDFAGTLKGTKIKLIAEVKKASPSRGLLAPDFDPVALAKTYEQHGAVALSVLTEVNHFQGKLEYLTAIRKAVKIPLLRKDFIFDEYQVYESAANGADAILLITAILKPEKLRGLMELSQKLDLNCLVEVHNEEELTTAMLEGAEIIGINNRDLKTFKTDINVTRRLRMLVPKDMVVVSESGISTAADMKKMKEMKVNAVLVGEALVTAKDIPAKMRELLS